MIKSLRARLLLGTVATMVLLLGLLGVAVDVSVRQNLAVDFDNALLAKAQSISSFVEQNGGHVRFEFDPQRMPEFHRGPRPAFFEVWVNGKLLDTSDSLSPGQRISSQSPRAAQPEFSTISLPNGLPGRLVAFPYAAYLDEDSHTTAPRARGIVCVAVDTVDLDKTLLRLRTTIAALSCGAILLSALALLAVVTRAIAPVRTVARKIESLNETDLSARIYVAGLPSELRPMLDRLNGLLERLESAFDRERSFTADVAHELRTPIAGLRTTLEVCRSRPRDPAVYTAAIDRSLKVIHSMQTVIENLLLLARAESGQLPLNISDTDLADIIRDAWSLFAAQAADAQLTFHLHLPESCIVPVDAPKLRIVLTNLFDNAVSYTPPGGEISVHLTPVSTHTEVRVSNTGVQLHPTDLPRLFERFWRKDAARSQTGFHAGLGLSLCQRLLALLHSEITPTIEGDRFSVTFHLPQCVAECVNQPPS